MEPTSHLNTEGSPHDMGYVCGLHGSLTLVPNSSIKCKNLRVYNTTGESQSS